MFRVWGNTAVKVKIASIDLCVARARVTCAYAELFLSGIKLLHCIADAYRSRNRSSGQVLAYPTMKLEFFREAKRK